VPLRPLGLGDVFGGAVRYIRANPVSTLGVAFIGLLVVQAVQVAAQLVLAPPSTATSLATLGAYLTGTLAASGIVVVIAVVVGAALTAMLLTVLRGALIGRQTSIGEAWGSAAPKLAGMVGLNLLIGLALVLVMGVGFGLAAVIVGLGRASTVTVIAAVVIGLAAVVLAIYIGILLSFAAPAYVMEGGGVPAALSRSRALVRGAWWRVFGIVLLAGLLIGAVNLIVSIPLSLLGARSALSGLGSVGAVTPGLLITSAVVTLIVGTFSAPFISGITGLLYVDQRIRRERFDLELATRSASQQPW
jgi:hypothetical protein